MTTRDVKVPEEWASFDHRRMDAHYFIGHPLVNAYAVAEDAAARAANGYVAVVHRHAKSEPCSEECATHRPEEDS